MSLHEYRVGQLYHPGRTRWNEGAQYNYRGGGHELLLFYERPSLREREAVRAGRAEFRLVVLADVLFLVYRFGDGPWQDAPYSWWRVPEAERQIPETVLSEQRALLTVLPEQRALLTVLLVDAATGLLEAIRTLTLGSPFTRALHRAIRDQAAREPAPGAYEAAVSRTYQQYSTAQLRDLATARCTGGD